ncbi:MAG TPA: hypothetical protein VMP67_03110 [Candidatus Limnocylindria bacterium]|nr:hypothetical protein [Candidatus Limnocylindria bacterium]
MRGQEEEALLTDAYIDALLAAHAGAEPALAPPDLPADSLLRRTIEVLEAGLPRFHPSFLFEEALAARLRAAALGARPSSTHDPLAAELIHLPVAATGGLSVVAVDRRLLVGGAIASGVSLAGAAMLAWRRRERDRERPSLGGRRRWLA